MRFCATIISSYGETLWLEERIEAFWVSNGKSKSELNLKMQFRELLTSQKLFPSYDFQFK